MGYKDVEKNFIWLRGILALCPDKVPSGFMVADALVMLRLKLNSMMLKPQHGQTVEALALAESAKLKRLVGHLR